MVFLSLCGLCRGRALRGQSLALAAPGTSRATSADGVGCVGTGPVCTCDGMSVRRDDPTLTYTFERCIGKGSYGKVYRAVPKAGGETVAFKVLPLEDGESSISLDMRRELLSLRECDHPRVVRYHDAYIRDNRLWIAMEYCMCSAQGVIRTSQRPLSEPQLACVLVEALRGLHYLHSERQIIHRDVKAGNILITAAGQGQLVANGVCAAV